MHQSLWKRMINKIELYLPMTVSSLLIFAFTIYLFVVIGRSIWLNYQSNKDIDNQALKVVQLKNDIKDLNNEINYYQTYSYKEKEARAKLGYKTPGENVISLPLDKKEDKVADEELGQVQIKTPNYQLWWRYLFES